MRGFRVLGVLIIVLVLLGLACNGGDKDVFGNSGDNTIGKRVDDAASNLIDLVPESAPGTIGTGCTPTLGDGLGIADCLFGD